MTESTDVADAPAVPVPVVTPFIQLLGQSGGCCEGDSCGI